MAGRGEDGRKTDGQSPGGGSGDSVTSWGTEGGGGRRKLPVMSVVENGNSGGVEIDQKKIELKV